MKTELIYRVWWLSRRLYVYKVPIAPFVLQQFLRVVFACYIPYKANIGRDVHFGHLGMGVVVHPGCTIGDRVTVSQHVTIGGRNDTGLPVIGNDVMIGAGAQVLGGVRIGDNAQIGANAVVITDVPESATAVGVPARIVRRHGRSAVAEVAPSRVNV